MFLETETASPHSIGFDETFRYRRDRILLKNIATLQFVALVNIFVLTVFLAGDMVVSLLVSWFVLMVSLVAIRLGFVLVLLTRQRVLEKVHLVTHDSIAAITGILWGAVPFLLVPGAPEESLYVIVFMIAGMTAGTALAFASHIRTVVAFTFPALCMLGVYQLIDPTFASYMVCLILVMYFASILSLSVRSGKTLYASIANEIKAEDRQVELDQKEKALHEETLRRAEKEAELQSNLEKSQALNSELENISKQILKSRQQSAKEIFSDLLVRVSKVLDVERASIWLYTSERDAIECLSLYDERTGQSNDPAQLKVEDYPDYFEAIENSSVVDASFAREDTRTVHFNDSYFAPLDIYSLLDAPILSSAGHRGVICCEAVGRVHIWTPDEISFVGSVAQLIGMVLLSEEADDLARDLQSALQETRRASATKSTFLANMSHEIRTPMNGVLGAATALKDMELAQEQLKLVNVIQDSGDALMTVLNDILDFSKIEAGRVQVENAPFSLRSVIGKVASIHQLKAREYGLEFDLRVAPELPDQFMGDAHRLGQVLHNLLSNAIKFTHEGSVQITAKKASSVEGKTVEIYVCDTGVGMTAEEAGRAFEKFAQADDSTTRKYGGTGLGLSIVKGLVEAMNGTLTCRTEKGLGSTFTIALPLQEAQAASTLQQAEETPALTAELPVKILVAEDNETNRLIIETFLKPFELDIVTVENGAEAVEAYSAGDFEVVLMDIQMPVMDGGQALQEIRRIEREHGWLHVPVIATTANAMTHQIELYRSLGFDSHLPKPIRRDALLDVLYESRTAYRAQKAVSLRA